MTRTLWSINGLATELQRDRRTVAEAMSAIPSDGAAHGRPAWFMSTATAAIFRGSDLDPAQERARKDRALAIAAEIKNDLAMGNVVPVDVAIAGVNVQLRKLRNKLLGLPSRIASRVPSQVKTETFTLTEAEVHSMMCELSAGGDMHVTLEEIEAEAEKMA